MVQFESTPKAFANFSPGLERKRQPWVSNSKYTLNPERVRPVANPYRVSIHRWVTTPGFSLRSNPRLKLANAFGVFFQTEPVPNKAAPGRRTPGRRSSSGAKFQTATLRENHYKGRRIASTLHSSYCEHSLAGLTPSICSRHHLQCSPQAVVKVRSYGNGIREDCIDSTATRSKKPTT